jgi:hypothetical protein
MQPYPDEDSVVKPSINKITDTYAEAGHPFNPEMGVHIARITNDYKDGMSWASSESKHLRALQAQLGIVPPIPPQVALPRLVRNGWVFKKETGEPFTVILNSDFNLFARYQAGEDITPVLLQRSSAGFNTLRVWTLFNIPGIGTLLNPDYSLIPAFLQLCACYGLYVEFTAFTSTERESHWLDLTSMCVEPTNVLAELVNEGDLPVNRIDMAKYAKPAGVLASHGSCGSETVPSWDEWDYITFHTNGAFEEQRKVGHNAMEIWPGPTLTNETSRFPDVGMWRWKSGETDATRLERCKRLAYDSAAGAALLCAGSCFHSALGKTSQLWDAPTLAVAEAWAAGAKSVALECQLKPYVHRIDLETPGILRVYQRGDCLVYIRE